MSNEFQIVVRRDGRVLWLEINRPAKRNALTAAMYAQLTTALVEANGDCSIRAVVLSGCGSTFCAGTDLQGFEQPRIDVNDSPAMAFIRALHRCEKPLIAAVNGLAIGIGVTLLLHCDLVFAADTASFRLPFVNLGVVPEAGSSLLLPQRVGTQTATRWLLLGEPIDAAEALAAGLISDVFTGAELRARVGEIAQRLASQPQQAVSATRALLRGDLQSLEQRIDVEMVLFARLLDSNDSREARSALRDKRVPRFA